MKLSSSCSAARPLLRLLAMACALATCDALHLAAPMPPRHACAAAATRACAPCAMADADSTVEIKTTGPTEEELAAIRAAEAEDPLMIAAGGDSDFVRWYRYEKAKEQYLKENPNDLLANAFDRLKGPATSLAVITAGFYSIPLIRGIAEGVRDGDVLGSVSAQFANPTDSVKF